MRKLLKQEKMKKLKINLMQIKAILFKSFLLALPFAVILSCSTYDTQTVAQFTELVMAD